MNAPDPLPSDDAAREARQIDLGRAIAGDPAHDLLLLVVRGMEEETAGERGPERRGERDV